MLLEMAKSTERLTLTHLVGNKKNTETREKDLGVPFQDHFHLK